jgi:hypothetical protein
VLYVSITLTCLIIFEQQTELKFLIKLKKTAAESYKILEEDYRASAMSKG